MSKRAEDVQFRRQGRRARRFLCRAATILALVHAGTAHAAGPVALVNARLASPTLATPVAVFGVDDRRPLPSALQALENKIGLLYDQRSRSVCTAFCVDDDIVATAAHCLYRTSGERPSSLSGFSFRLARQPAKSLARVAGVSTNSAAQNVVSGTMSLSVRPPIDAAHDWALVRLSSPACKGNRLPISHHASRDLVPLSSEGRVYQVAFHRDYANWQLALGGPCLVRQSFPGNDWKTISRDFTDPEHLILHTCDTGGASSGSPLLVDGPSGPEVVGINVGTYVQSKVLMQNGAILRRYRSDNVANTGVDAVALGEALAAIRQSTILADRRDMLKLQVLLGKLGYFDGRTDGVYGRDSREAIESFERAEGRRVTGMATAELLSHLADLGAGREASRIAAEPRQLETGSVGRMKPSQGGPVPGR